MISQDTQIMRINMGGKITKMGNESMSPRKENKQLNEQNHLMKIYLPEANKKQSVHALKNNK